MADSQQPYVRIAANTATETLRSLIDIADRAEARRIHAELLRIAGKLAEKHNFIGRNQPAPALGG